MGKRLSWAVAAGLAAIALFLFLSSRPAERGAPDPSTPERASSVAAGDLGGAHTTRDAADPRADRAYAAELPGSLRGTEEVGGFAVGPDGHLVPTPDAIALFDYYLAATGEEPEAALRARIVDAVHARLEGEAADEAIALLDDYLAFRDEMRALAEAGEPPHDLERRLQWIRELRRAHFGEGTADALFGLEEKMTAIDLERRRVAFDESLDEAERAERLAQLDAELPESVRVARERARAPARSQKRVEAMREAGASEEEIFDARAEQFGPEAAERLAALDAEQAEWQRRLDAFRRDRAALEAEGLESAEYQAEIDALLDAHFEEHEYRRVRAIESL